MEVISSIEDADFIILERERDLEGYPTFNFFRIMLIYKKLICKGTENQTMLLRVSFSFFYFKKEK